MSAKVRVIGGGISGLMTAYFLAKKGIVVEVFEKNQLGGKIQTTTGRLGLMESAANAILADLCVEEVAKDIGLELVTTTPKSRKRFILNRGNPSRWPIGFLSTLRFIFFLFKLVFFKQRVTPKNHETLFCWAERTVGLEFTRQLLDPACQGIFSATSDDLSALLIFKYFFCRDKNPKGKWKGSLAPRGGMGEWSLKLYQFLKDRGVSFYPESGRWEQGEVVVVATDLLSAREILTEINDPRGRQLEKVPFVDLVSVNVFFSSAPLEGFGLLFPRSGSIEPLGVLFNSHIFESRSQNGISSETWIFGKQPTYDLLQKSDEEIMAEICAVREKLWGVTEAPLDYKINRWEKALPLYGLELERVLEDLPLERNNVYLMGNYLGQIGLNRIFHQARRMADLIASGGKE